MTFKTGAIIQRKYQEMFNSKLSSLAIVIGPIIMILVAGIALSDNSLRNVKANIYVGEGSEFADKLADRLREESFNLVVSPTLGDCRWPVLEGGSQACIEIIRRNTDNPVLEGYDSYGYEVKLHVDFSRQRTVWAVVNTVRELVEEESSKTRGRIADELKAELSAVIADIDDALDEVVNAKRELNNVKNEIDVAQYKIDNLQNSVEEADQTLDEIGEIIFLLEVNGANIVAPNEFANLKFRHSEAKQDITQVKYDLIQAEETLFEIESKIPPTIQALEETEEYLREIQDNLVLIRESNINELLNPIPMTYTPVSGRGVGEEIEEEFNLLDYIFPSFLMFFVMFASIILSTSSTIKERSSPAFIRNMLSKARGFSFVIGNFFTTFSIVILQVIVIILVGSRFLGLNLMDNVGPMSVVLLIAIAWFILIGQVIGYLVKSSESSNIAAVSLALILLIFMPAITPTETLPEPLSGVIRVLPSNVFETQLRAITLFGVPFGLRYVETASLLISSFVLMIILSLLYLKAKRKEI